MTIARVREREVESKIVISEGEIDNFLSGETAENQASEEYEVAHILLRSPEAASPEQIQRLKAKADQIYGRLKAGEDFAQLAAAYSDAPDGLQGGSLGMRPLDRLPSIFFRRRRQAGVWRGRAGVAQCERISPCQTGG